MTMIRATLAIKSSDQHNLQTKDKQIKARKYMCHFFIPFSFKTSSWSSQSKKIRNDRRKYDLCKQEILYDNANDTRYHEIHLALKIIFYWSSPIPFEGLPLNMQSYFASNFGQARQIFEESEAPYSRANRWPYPEFPHRDSHRVSQLLANSKEEKVKN